MAIRPTLSKLIGKKNRSHIRKRKHIFCNMECYYAYIEGLQQGEYNQSRQGQRVARAVISQYFTLKPGNIVHHEDRNNKNNYPSNLKVFANQEITSDTTDGLRMVLKSSPYGMAQLCVSSRQLVPHVSHSSTLSAACTTFRSVTAAGLAYLLYGLGLAPGRNSLISLANQSSNCLTGHQLYRD